MLWANLGNGRHTSVLTQFESAESEYVFKLDFTFSMFLNEKKIKMHAIWIKYGWVT